MSKISCFCFFSVHVYSKRIKLSEGNIAPLKALFYRTAIYDHSQSKTMHKNLFITGLILLFFSGFSQKKLLSGFSDAGAKEQRALEAKFDSLLDAKDIDHSIREMSAHPHHVGSPG